jgi:hypothetical protein
MHLSLFCAIDSYNLKKSSLFYICSDQYIYIYNYNTKRKVTIAKAFLLAVTELLSISDISSTLLLDIGSTDGGEVKELFSVLVTVVGMLKEI